MSEKLQAGSPEWIDFVCTYQPCTPDDEVKYAAIKEAAIKFMEAVFKNTPRCADQSAAIRHIREARMIANAAIALKGLI